MIQQVEETMKTLTKNWWLFILRGVLAILFGILVVAWPSLSIYALVILFGAYALVEGISLIIHAFYEKRHWSIRAWLIFWGIAGIAAGVVALAWPDITAVALLLVIAVWAFATGIAQVFFAFVAATSIGNRLWLALSGVFSIIFGVFLVARPDLGALAVIWIISIFAVMSGVYLIAFGISLRDLKTEAPVK